MRPDSFDLIVFAGVCTVVYGVHLIYPPAAVIFGGLYLIAVGVASAFASKGTKATDKETN